MSATPKTHWPEGLTNRCRGTFHRGLSLVVCVFALLVALAAGGPLLGTAGTATHERLVAVGDVHGDLDALAAILRQAGVIDAQHRWIGRNVTLVQTGDYLGRGPKSRAVMDLLMALEEQAPRIGGRALALLGNHEMMNLVGDLRYVTPEDYASFADDESEKRQSAAYESYQEYCQRRAEALNQPDPKFTLKMEERWKKTHPVGLVEHRQAFGPEGNYGRWLRGRPPVVELNGTILLHGSISPTLAGSKVQEMNEQIKNEIKAFDAYKQYFLEQNLVLPFFNLEEMIAAVREEVKARKKDASKTPGATTKEGEVSELSRQRGQHLKIMEDFLGLGGWLSFHPEGPLWFRGFAQWSDQQGAQFLASLLPAFGAKRFVVGHTVQPDGRIRARFGGKVFLIDTGMLSSYFPGGQASALEIQSDTITAIYLNRRTVLQASKNH
jgi:hypothetical protein